MRAFLSRLGLILFGLCFGLLLIELLIRVLGGALLPANLRWALTVRAAVAAQEAQYMQDDYLGRVLKPGLDVTHTLPGEFSYPLRTSDLGLGGPGFREETVQTPAFAVAVGDSFTFGLGVPAQETWVQRLQEELGREIVNLGQPGFGPVRTARVYERFGSGMQPQLVLWLLVPNDLEDGLLFNGMGAPSTRTPDGLDRLFDLLRPFSRLALITEFSLGRGPLAWAGGYTTRSIAGQTVSFHPTLLARQINLADPVIETGWWISRNAIAETAARAQAEGAHFLLLLAPVRERTYMHLLSEDAGPTAFDTDPLYDRYRQLGEELGFPVLDLTPAFVQRGQAGELLFFPSDGHWNAQGHALVAETLAAYLRDRGWQ